MWDEPPNPTRREPTRHRRAHRAMRGVRHRPRRPRSTAQPDGPSRGDGDQRPRPLRARCVRHQRRVDRSLRQRPCEPDHPRFAASRVRARPTGHRRNVVGVRRLASHRHGDRRRAPVGHRDDRHDDHHVGRRDADPNGRRVDPMPPDATVGRRSHLGAHRCGRHVGRHVGRHGEGPNGRRGDPSSIPIDGHRGRPGGHGLRRSTDGPFRVLRSRHRRCGPPHHCASWTHRRTKHPVGPNRHAPDPDHHRCSIGHDQCPRSIRFRSIPERRSGRQCSGRRAGRRPRWVDRFPTNDQNRRPTEPSRPRDDPGRHRSRSSGSRSGRARAVRTRTNWASEEPTGQRRGAKRPQNDERTPEGVLSSEKSGGVLLSRGVSSQVPSALVGLTSVFGMGTGVTPPPWPPKSCQRGRRPTRGRNRRGPFRTP